VPKVSCRFEIYSIQIEWFLDRFPVVISFGSPRGLQNIFLYPDLTGAFGGLGRLIFVSRVGTVVLGRSSRATECRLQLQYG
jgi:hypothetical protein